MRLSRGGYRPGRLIFSKTDIFASPDLEQEPVIK